MIPIVLSCFKCSLSILHGTISERRSQLAYFFRTTCIILVNLQVFTGSKKLSDKEDTELSLCVSLCHCYHYSILVIGNNKGEPHIRLIQFQLQLLNLLQQS